MGLDGALLQRFRDGDAQAMSEVYREHVAVLTRLLRAAARQGQTFAALRSPMELENVIVEVFSRAFEPRARQVYDGVRPYETFLMGIARNVLLERLRQREEPAGLELLAELDATLAMDAPGAHELLEDREVEALLRGFRAGLGADEGQLFDLRFVDGLAQVTAAERLGQTRIQLRRREFKLRLKLLDYLKRHGYLGDLGATGWSFVKENA